MHLFVGKTKVPRTWFCPECGDKFMRPNTPHPCSQRKHEKHTKRMLNKGFRQGFILGLLLSLFAGMGIFIIVQTQLIGTYADLISYTRIEMATMHKVNSVILEEWATNSRPYHKRR